MAQNNKPAPMKVTIPNGPTFVTNDIVEFAFDPNNEHFQAAYKKYKDAKASLDAALYQFALAAFRDATGHGLPAGYEIKAGLSRFGGAQSGKGWLVVDTAKAAKPKADTKRGFGKWA